MPAPSSLDCVEQTFTRRLGSEGDEEQACTHQTKAVISFGRDQESIQAIVHFDTENT